MVLLHILLAIAMIYKTHEFQQQYFLLHISKDMVFILLLKTSDKQRSFFLSVVLSNLPGSMTVISSCNRTSNFLMSSSMTVSSGCSFLVLILLLQRTISNEMNANDLSSTTSFPIPKQRLMHQRDLNQTLWFSI